MMLLIVGAIFVPIALVAVVSLGSVRHLRNEHLMAEAAQWQKDVQEIMFRRYK
jgi:hypothetical protein